MKFKDALKIYLKEGDEISYSLEYESKILNGKIDNIGEHKCKVKVGNETTLFTSMDGAVIAYSNSIE